LQQPFILLFDVYMQNM